LFQKRLGKDEMIVSFEVDAPRLAAARAFSSTCRAA
jgi:hypothetical protein